jgi:hypothetical protein
VSHVSAPARRRAVFVGCICLLGVLGACGDREVVTASFATLEEAVSEGAAIEGRLPRGLPPGTREIREAHDRKGPRRWGLFEFPAAQGEALRALLGREVPFGGERCNPPRRIEWWPVQLRGQLDEERLVATGLQAYEARENDLIFAVNWGQGRAYYWTRER